MPSLSVEKAREALVKITFFSLFFFFFSNGSMVLAEARELGWGLLGKRSVLNQSAEAFILRKVFTQIVWSFFIFPLF